jgi:molybdopterin-containing oxidoreductase family membrane subunit
MPTIVSVFDRPQDVAAAVTKLKGRGFDDVEAYSPAPFEEIEDACDPKPSLVRLFTLIGGLAGVFTGFFIQIWMSLDWPIKIAGKPFASIPPYVIIGFELTILFGGLLTFVGLLAVGGLYPRFNLDKGYSPRFSAEEFGVVVECSDKDAAEVNNLLRASNAKEVNLVDH